MSEHRFVCPCGQHLSCDDSMIGKKIACPTCGTRLLLSAPKSSVAQTINDESLVRANRKRQQYQQGQHQPGNSPARAAGVQQKPIIEVVRTEDDYQRKSRIIYIILGVGFGGLGIHNFYAGYNREGRAQLLISLLAPFSTLLLLGPIIALPILWIDAIGMWIWVIYNLVTRDCDANGMKMES